MSCLFATADRIGEISGGGAVSAQECLALREFSDNQVAATHDYSLAEVVVLSRDNLGSQHPEPWKWDLRAAEFIKNYAQPIRLAHFYSGTWPTTIPILKERGIKVCITIAAHDREVSRKEHEKLGWPFPYEHLTNSLLWKKYIEGYRQADVIVCPSSVAEKTVRNYGVDFQHKTIRVIPHGCHLPQEVKPLPGSYVVGYLGSLGADKGVKYLLEAWKRLNYTDGSLLVLAGRDSTSNLARHLIDRYGGGNVRLAGWQDNVADFYNSISLFVCPAATEGFNIEVLESLSYGRPVICSRGAGASNLVDDEATVKSCDVDELTSLIDDAKMKWDKEGLGKVNRKRAEDYTWDKIRKQYKSMWTEVLVG